MDYGEYKEKIARKRRKKLEKVKVNIEMDSFLQWRIIDISGIYIMQQTMLGRGMAAGGKNDKCTWSRHRNLFR